MSVIDIVPFIHFTIESHTMIIRNKGEWFLIYKWQEQAQNAFHFCQKSTICFDYIDYMKVGPGKANSIRLLNMEFIYRKKVLFIAHFLFITH